MFKNLREKLFAMEIKRVKDIIANDKEDVNKLSDRFQIKTKEKKDNLNDKSSPLVGHKKESKTQSEKGENIEKTGDINENVKSSTQRNKGMKDNNINNSTDNEVKDKLNPSQQKEIVLDDLNDKSINHKIGEKKR